MAHLKVAFVWHMHQPWYLWPGSERAALPFVRLYASASYYDMPWLVRHFEQTIVTFNLVPSLTEQLRRYASGKTTDRMFELSQRPASALEPEEQRYLLRQLRAWHGERFSQVSPRYRQLLDQAAQLEGCTTGRGLPSLSTQDLRDLQVWLNLLWCGYALQKESEVVRSLWAKGQGFTEDEKQALLAEMQAAVERVLPLYRTVQAEGKAELTTSPFYHPILPLLCNMQDAQRRIERSQLPAHLLQAPEEAEEQLGRARAHHAATFGLLPQGLWPPEGAVSDAALAVIARAGFSWALSDQHVLAHSLSDPPPQSLSPEKLCRAYRVGDTNLTLLFRDQGLSDAIGFTYKAKPPQEAAEDLLARLVALAGQLAGAAVPPLVCLVVDGENPWGGYVDRGEQFLRTVYAGIEAHPALETVSISQYLQEFPPTERLASVFPGSWIDCSYRTWIGSEAHREAWEWLYGAWQAVRQAPPSAAWQQAREHLMIAEGSDWFWWRSEEHYTADQEVFDALFRAQVAAVTALLSSAHAP
jgi:alpha-amylase/alpha-mannosidase (GH57 family)